MPNGGRICSAATNGCRRTIRTRRFCRLASATSAAAWTKEATADGWNLPHLRVGLAPGWACDRPTASVSNSAAGAHPGNRSRRQHHQTSDCRRPAGQSANVRRERRSPPSQLVTLVLISTEVVDGRSAGIEQRGDAGGPRFSVLRLAPAAWPWKILWRHRAGYPQPTGRCR